MGLTRRIELAGMVFRVTYEGPDGWSAPGQKKVFDEFQEQGYDVEAVHGPGIDGAYIVEIRAAGDALQLSRKGGAR